MSSFFKLFSFKLSKSKDTQRNNSIRQSSSTKKNATTQSNKSAKKLLEQKYKQNDYENIPYIVDEARAKFVLDNFNLAVPVPKEYMKNITSDPINLIRGDIIALWWLNNPRTKKDRTPKYFSQNYGINLSKEIDRMLEAGLIDRNHKLTNMGLKILSDHKQIIQEHKGNSSWSGVGPVHHDISNTLKGDAKKKAMLKERLYWFDNQLESGVKNGYRFYSWIAANNSCQKCTELATKDSGWGPGVYTYTQLKKLRKYIHYDCRCSISETWVEGENNFLN